jgi:glucose dehydrogenase
MREIRIAACALSLGGLLGASLGAAQPPAASEQWPTYGGNLASQRYSALDQINKDNFKDLRIAWRLRTDFLGPRPDTISGIITSRRTKSGSSLTALLIPDLPS